MRLQKGDDFPDFELPDENGETVRRKDLLGLRYVIYFYPKDNTSGCTTEAVEFTKELPRLMLRNIMVFGVSRDSAKSHTNFREKQGLRIKLLTDKDRAFTDQLGLLVDKTMYGKPVKGVLRSTFLVGKDGKVEAAWYGVKPEGHAKEVAEVALQRYRDDVASTEL